MCVHRARTDDAARRVRQGGDEGADDLTLLEEGQNVTSKRELGVLAVPIAAADAMGRTNARSSQEPSMLVLSEAVGNNSSSFSCNC